MPAAPVLSSYKNVRRISRRSGSSFYRSFWLLPRGKRDAMCALYAFARITDDLGDCDQPTESRTAWLNWWRETTRQSLLDDGAAIFDFSTSELANTQTSLGSLSDLAHQIMPALRDSQQRYEIPSRYFLEIIDGVLADQQKTRFDTYEQLEHYCYLVASAIGLACLHIWGFRDPLPEKPAIDCGLAFQLTNILRDIVEDAKRGRIYLPRQHYEQHGLCEDDLLTPRGDDRLVCLVEDETRRAIKLYDSGWQVFDSLEGRGGREMFSMIWRTYRQLLDRIAADPRSVASTRVRLSKSEKLRLFTGHFFPPLFRRLPVPPVEVGRT